MKKFFWTTAILLICGIIATGCSKDSTETPEPMPVITVGTVPTIPADGGTITIPIEIDPIVEGVMPTATSDQNWLEVTNVTTTAVTCTAQRYTEEEARTAVVTIAYQGAESRQVTLKQSGSNIEWLEFDIELLEIKSRMLILNCIPSDLEATYVGMVVTQAEADASTDEQLFQDNLEYFIEWGPSFGATNDEESIAMFLRRGAMENYEIQLDQPESDYCFIAYGMNVDGTMTSTHIYKESFRTPAPEEQELTFQIKIRPGVDYTQVNITPSDIHISYLWGVMLKSEFDALGENPAQGIIDNIQAEVDAAVEAGGEAYFGEYTVYHNQKGSFDELIEGEQYVVYAFGCDVKGYQISPIQTQEFTETRLEKVDCSFSVSFPSRRATMFACNITPSDNSVRWLGYTLPYEMMENYNTIEEMTEEVIEIFDNMSDFDWATNTEYIHTGAQELTSYDLLGGELTPETQQLVAVFGVNEEGSRITDVIQSSVTTIATGTPSDMTIEITPKLNGNDVEITFTPSIKELYFYDIQPTEHFDAYESEQTYMEDLLYSYSSLLLPYKETVGETKMTATGLKPGTEYMGLAFGIDGVISTRMFYERFTTASVPMGGSAEVTDIEIIVEDGDLYYQSDPSMYGDLQGKAVVTFNVTKSANTSLCYVAALTGTDPGMSDQEMVDMLVGYGATEDYTFAMEWDQESSVLAVALDQSGLAGSVYKEVFTPRKSDIQSSSITFGRTVHSQAGQQAAFESRIQKHQAQSVQPEVITLQSLMPLQAPKSMVKHVTTISNQSSKPSLQRVRNVAR